MISLNLCEDVRLPCTNKTAIRGSSSVNENRNAEETRKCDRKRGSGKTGEAVRGTPDAAIYPRIDDAAHMQKRCWLNEALVRRAVTELNHCYCIHQIRMFL